MAKKKSARQKRLRKKSMRQTKGGSGPDFSSQGEPGNPKHTGSAAGAEWAQAHGTFVNVGRVKKGNQRRGASGSYQENELE